MSVAGAGDVGSVTGRGVVSGWSVANMDGIRGGNCSGIILVPRVAFVTSVASVAFAAFVTFVAPAAVVVGRVKSEARMICDVATSNASHALFVT